MRKQYYFRDSPRGLLAWDADRLASIRRAHGVSRRCGPRVPETWHERWDAAEDYYFTEIRPPKSFDIVVDSGASRVSVRSKDA